MACARAFGSRAASVPALGTQPREARARLRLRENCCRSLPRILLTWNRSCLSRAPIHAALICFFDAFLLDSQGVESAQNQAELAPSAGPSCQEETMRRTVVVLSAILLASFAVLYAGVNSRQEKPGSTEPKMSPTDFPKKNPPPPPPEGWAEARDLSGHTSARF